MWRLFWKRHVDISVSICASFIRTATIALEKKEEMSESVVNQIVFFPLNTFLVAGKHVPSRPRRSCVIPLGAKRRAWPNVSKKPHCHPPLTPVFFFFPFLCSRSRSGSQCTLHAGLLIDLVLHCKWVIHISAGSRSKWGRSRRGEGQPYPAAAGIH